jgi:hypothetical protein
MYTNQLYEDFTQGGSPMIWKPIALLASLSLLCGGVSENLAQIVAPIKGPSFAENTAQYTDLLAEDGDFTFSIKFRSHSETMQSFGFYLEDNGNENYVLGSYTEENNFPLSFIYTVTKTDGTTEDRTAVSEAKSTLGYDGIGNSFAAVTTFENSADLPINAGETVDYKSFRIFNIFHVTETKKEVGGVPVYTYTPDYTKNYILKGPTLRAAAIRDYALDDFVKDTALVSVSTFNNYVSVLCRYTCVADEQFKKYSTVYQANADDVAAGNQSIRMRFNSLTNTKLRVNYADGTNEVRLIRGTDYLKMNNSGTFQFLLTDLQSKQIASFDLLNATVYCDLWENTKATIITRSASSWRFGQVNFALTNNATTAPVKNYVVTMIVTSVVFIVIFALAALGLFFYQKNKYKNDEFNRVVPKEYVKKASVAFAYLLLWTEEILSLLARNIFFRNSLIVFNPFDVLIIIFSIILIIYTGYYIKYFLARFKDWRVKRMEERLKLGDGVADDGTVTTKK